jgi:hypothetical protein
VMPATPDFPERAAAVADWVWLDWPAHFRPEWVALYRDHGAGDWLTRGRVEEEAARWRATLGDERVKTGREWFAWRFGEDRPRRAVAEALPLAQQPLV